MQKSMHKRYCVLLVVAICLTGQKLSSQSFFTLLQIENLIDDSLEYGSKYLTPATDAAIYQASSGWVATPQKRKLWDVSLSFHTNVFFVPRSNRTFVAKNSDFSFYSIEGASSAVVPTALGDDYQVYLVGYIDDGVNQNQVRIKSPEGVDSETVVYSYLQASVGLLYGTELTAKFSPKIKLKKGDYQVYGAGLKHNLSQYSTELESKNIYASAFAGYSKEKISFDFLDAQTSFGSLGLNEISGLVDTWQFQVNASKKWNKFEVMSGLILNTSSIDYELGGDSSESLILSRVKTFIDQRLAEISENKTNIIGEVSCRYQLGKFYIQPVVAFGKFINTNFALAFEF